MWVSPKVTGLVNDVGSGPSGPVVSALCITPHCLSQQGVHMYIKESHYHTRHAVIQ